MRFKEFLKLEMLGSPGNSVQDRPGANLNTALPVQSKISTKDGSDAPVPDAADGKIKPDDLFHFRSSADKKAAAKRSQQWIDNNRKTAGRTVTIPPDIIY